MELQPKYENTKRIAAANQREGSVVIAVGDGVLKNLGPKEVSTLSVLEQHRTELEQEFVFPHYLGQISLEEHLALSNIFPDLPTAMHVLSRVDGIKPVGINEHFGQGIKYNSADFQQFFRGFDHLRKTFAGDGHNFQSFSGGWERFVEDSRIMIDNKTALNHDKLVSTLQKASLISSDLPNMVAHRDPSWGNIAIVLSDGQRRVGMIDFETMGLQKPGYDEGRMMTHLSLNPRKQKEFEDTYLQYVAENPGYPEQALLASFYMTAATRAYREMGLLLNGGHYCAKISHTYGPDYDDGQINTRKAEFYQNLTHALEDTTTKAMKEIEKL